MADIREALSHVLWIGGGPQAGKTTLSRILAGKYDLKVYELDWHGGREHRSPPGEQEASFERMSMDERWVRPAPDELLERSIVAEGPGALPWCVAPVVASPRQALFLVPTPGVREGVARRRPAGRAYRVVVPGTPSALRTRGWIA